MNQFSIPLIAFIAIVILLGVGLSSLKPREIPSPLIDKLAPSFSLPQLDINEDPVEDKDFRGKVWLLNVWASWCTACLYEHPLLVKISNTNVIPLVGLNYKDTRNNALNWLKKGGNPYIKNAFDQSGNVSIDYGVYGVPETFLIDKHGVIRLKHIGPLTYNDLKNTLLPLIKRLKEEE